MEQKSLTELPVLQTSYEIFRTQLLPDSSTTNGRGRVNYLPLPIVSVLFIHFYDHTIPLTSILMLRGKKREDGNIQNLTPESLISIQCQHVQSLRER